MKPMLSLMGLAVGMATLLAIGVAPMALAVPTAPAATADLSPAVAIPAPNRHNGGVTDVPPAMLALYEQAATRCPGLSWAVLAGIGKVETDHGRGAEVSAAGAEGPMQFLPSTWAKYGVDGDGDGVASIWEAADAVPAAADYLCANGGGDRAHLRDAIFRYNHDDGYVTTVLAWAQRYAAAVTGG